MERCEAQQRVCSGLTDRQLCDGGAQAYTGEATSTQHGHLVLIWVYIPIAQIVLLHLDAWNHKLDILTHRSNRTMLL